MAHRLVRSRATPEHPSSSALESVHARLRKIIKTRGHFPNDEAATKLLWLALRNITATWVRAAPTWKTAMNQFAILYPAPTRIIVLLEGRSEERLTHRIPDTPP